MKKAFLILRSVRKTQKVISLLFFAILFSSSTFSQTKLSDIYMRSIPKSNGKLVAFDNSMNFKYQAKLTDNGFTYKVDNPQLLYDPSYNYLLIVGETDKDGCHTDFAYQPKYNNHILYLTEMAIKYSSPMQGYLYFSNFSSSKLKEISFTHLYDKMPAFCKFKGYVVGFTSMFNYFNAEIVNENPAKENDPYACITSNPSFGRSFRTDQKDISGYITNEYKALGDKFPVSVYEDNIFDLAGIKFSVEAVFYDDILFEIRLHNENHLEYDDFEKVNQLILVFITKYGDPTSSNSTGPATYIWENTTNKLSLTISYYENRPSGVNILYWSKSLMSLIYDDFINEQGDQIKRESNKF